MIYDIYVYPIPAQEISRSKQKHEFCLYWKTERFCFLQCSQTHEDYYATGITNWANATGSSIAFVQFGLTFSNNRPFDRPIFTIEVHAVQTPLYVMIEITSPKKIRYKLLYRTRRVVTTQN